MKIWPGFVAAGATVALLVACSQAAPPAVNSTTTSAATSVIEGATAIVTAVEGHFNPTEAVGGGANSSSTITDLASVFASVPQASQLRLSANITPPGSTGPNVESVSVVAQDSGGVLKGLDATAKKSLGDAILTAASTAWPNATISLLVSDPAGGGGQIIGSRPKGGPNTVLAT